MRTDLKELSNQMKAASMAANKAISISLSEVQKNLSEDDYIKWKDLTGRMIEARLKGNEKMVESLTNDLKNLLGGD